MKFMRSGNTAKVGWIAKVKAMLDVMEGVNYCFASFPIAQTHNSADGSGNDGNEGKNCIRLIQESANK